MDNSSLDGATISHYRVLAKIGEGGMGEVYRARDTQLGRDVAIKVLPAAFSEDADRLRRFEQEAQAAGGLNHPNILVIYHVGEHQGAPYIVSELLEGETLRERTAGTALSQRKAMDYGLQIAHGLAAAHAKGIVHRDLKPENLFITNDGRVKILDFGLAKLTGAADGNLSQTEVPTRRVDTDPGLVMGTMGYMSPEQLRGKPADHRSDIFSFGAILYEMLSGKRAFRGGSIAETMSAILREDPPDLSETNKTISPALERVVQHCLEKNPEERFHSARDLAFAIESLSGTATSSGHTMAIAALTTATDGRQTTGITRLFGNARAAWIAAGLLFIGLLAVLPFALTHFRRTETQSPVAVRFTITRPEKVAGFNQLAISPDGRNLVFVSFVEGKSQLWLRPLGSFTARPLPGTEDANGFPFWSPDSRSIGFQAAGKLKKIDLSDGTQQTLCDNPGSPRGAGGTWNGEGTILFFRSEGIYRISAAGGAPAPVSGLEASPQGIECRWPSFLPDGNHFLYLATTPQQETSGVYLASLDGKETKRLFTADSSAIYAPSAGGGGYLLFARDGALLAQPFDASRLTLMSEPFRIADQVRVNANSRGFFSVSDNGTLVYDPSGERENQQLTWFDRAGKQLETIGALGTFLSPRLSPDEKRVAVSRRDPKTGNFDIYVIDIARGASSRLTSDSANVNVVWSPDGSRIVWATNRGGSYQFYQKLASGVGQEELLLQSNNRIYPTDWSADGRFILYRQVDPKTREDLWILPLDGDRKPFPFLQTPFAETTARFSSDGRWLAYDSDESGNREVYVQTFPASGGKWPVSTKGGGFTQWRRDGKELFYISSDLKMMAVEVKTSGTFEPGIPRALFDLSAVRPIPRSGYAVAGDGQRFLFVSQIAETAPSSLAVVVNWTADLKK
ncbi:MAG TPA: protein kinase [Pyrinomonadaceae bacterium]|jgi:Tol biopolymer transport system component